MKTTYRLPRLEDVGLTKDEFIGRHRDSVQREMNHNQENRFNIRSLECHFPYDFYAKYAIKIDVLSVLYGGS